MRIHSICQISKPKTNKAIDIDEKSVVTVDSKHNHLLRKFEKEAVILKNLKDTKVIIKQRLKRKDYEKY